METLLTRPVVIALAITGEVLYVLAILLRKREGRANLAHRIDTADYVFMRLCMLLFAISGFRGQA